MMDFQTFEEEVLPYICFYCRDKIIDTIDLVHHLLDCDDII